MSAIERPPVHSRDSGRARPSLKIIAALAVLLLISSGAGAPAGVYGSPPLEVDAIDLTKTLIDPPVGPAMVGDIVRFEIEVKNISPFTILVLPLHDHFDDQCMSFAGASPTPDDVIHSEGLLIYYNLAPLPPASTMWLEVEFLATAACDPAYNRVVICDGVTELGQMVEPVQDEAEVAIVNKGGQIRVWMPLVDKFSHSGTFQ